MTKLQRWSVPLIQQPAAADAATTTYTVPNPTLKRGGHGLTRPPNAPFVLNRESPQAKGLVGWWVSAGQYGGTNIFKNVLQGYFTDGIWNDPDLYWSSNSVYGRGLGFLGGSGDYAVTTVLGNAIRQDFSIYCRIDVADRLTRKDVFSSSGDSAVIRVDTGRIEFVINTGSGSRRAYIDNTATGVHDILGTYDGATVRGWLNGQLMPNTGSDSGDISDYSSFNIGVHANGSSNDFIGLIHEIRFYNRVLTQNDASHLYAPQTRWELYQPVAPPQFWSIPEAEAAEEEDTTTYVVPNPYFKRGGWALNRPPDTGFTLNRGSNQAKGLVGWWPTLGQGGGMYSEIIRGLGMMGL